MRIRLFFLAAAVAGLSGCRDDAPAAGADPAERSKEKPVAEASKTDGGTENRLAHETSPYLLQHKNNPVDWYPWGDEAFARAKAEDKAVLVSIGYSSCHWCHVMEHESFENPEIAAMMNELFVCIKVDREERPDVDEVYMTAVQLMGQRGGWPLNVFVTPDGQPFFGGTYYPPEDRYGRPGWPTVLQRIAHAWQTQRDQISEQAGQLVAALGQNSEFQARDGLPEAGLFEIARDQLAGGFDEVHGGFGDAPKFPPSLSLQFLLRRHRRTGNAEDLRIVEKTLTEMARGGMYDQVGGGFHRYSVDEQWLVPHFEKMLYDNAMLSRVYVEGWQVTGNDMFRRIAGEVYDYVLREMTEPAGGFRSATDADSDGREGVYFVWKLAELEEILGEEAPLFIKAYGATVDGNFEDVHHPRMPGEQGMNVLFLEQGLEEFAAAQGMEFPEVDRRLAAAREKLFKHRAGRTYPGLDDKVLVAWNGLMIGSFAYAGRVLDEPRYVAAAEKAADFILANMRRDDGRLLRTHRAGESKIPAFLEDYAFLASALLDLYEATFDPRWFREAQSLAAEMNRLFGDDEGGWRHTAGDGEKLVAEFKSPTDGAIPGGNGVAVQVMLRLATMTGDADARERAEAAFRLFRGPMERMPGGTMSMLIGLDRLLHADGEFAFVGDPDAKSVKSLVRRAQREFLPGAVFALLDPENPESEALIPLLEGKTLVGDEAAAYVCKDFACQAPVTEVEELEKLLADL
ncbi:MAG: thioredoxin domain-containing protein [Gemmatimonadetes bacterium]|nr:thioredoxin domain-containing protein [Gemmatimonadota bacterium]